MQINFAGKTAVISRSTGGIRRSIGKGHASSKVVTIRTTTSAVDKTVASINTEAVGRAWRIVADLGTATGAEPLFMANPAPTFW